MTTYKNVFRRIGKYEYYGVFHIFSKYVEIRPVVLGFLKYVKVDIEIEQE